MDNLSKALEVCPVTVGYDTLRVFGRAVTVSTVWLRGPWWTHETAIMWSHEGHDYFEVVATTPGSVSAERAHIHWSCWPVAARFVLSHEDSRSEV